jgi:hypothetical protein
MNFAGKIEPKPILWDYTRFTFTLLEVILNRFLLNIKFNDETFLSKNEFNCTHLKT